MPATVTARTARSAGPSAPPRRVSRGLRQPPSDATEPGMLAVTDQELDLGQAGTHERTDRARLGVHLTAQHPAENVTTAQRRRAVFTAASRRRSCGISSGDFLLLDRGQQRGLQHPAEEQTERDGHEDQHDVLVGIVDRWVAGQDGERLADPRDDGREGQR